MTLEKVFLLPFTGSNFIPNSPSEKKKVLRISGSPNSSIYSGHVKNNVNCHVVLSRTITRSASVINSPATDSSKDRKHSSKDTPSSSKDVKQQSHISQSSPRQDSDVKNCSVQLDSDSSVRRNSSFSTVRTSRTSQRSTPSQKSTCSREILLEFPSSMPKSSGRSSRSSVAKKSEKNKELKSGRSIGSLQEELLLDVKVKERRPHSADASPRQSTSCYFFSFMRRKKRESGDKSTSPDTKLSLRQDNPRRSNLSCSTPQSGPRSDCSSLPSHKDRKTSGHSLTSSRHPRTSVSSIQPPSATSPTAPLLGSDSPDRTRKSSDKPPKYTSRSRPKHRRERRQRTSKRVVRIHPDVRLRHEDLPPHPSIYKKAAVKANSHPITPCLKPGVNNTKSKKPSSDKNNYTSSHNSFDNQTDSLVRSRKSCGPESPENVKSSSSGQNITDLVSSRKNSRSESPVHPKSTVVSPSGQNLKDPSEDAAQNSRKQSQKTETSRTDLEDDSHYQFTTSSSDQLSRRSSRSRSLPSFCGDRLPLDADTKVISDAEDFEFNPTDMKGPLSLSMCGCGFLGMYHLGVVACLSQRGPSFLEKLEKVGGASAGALMAAVLVTARDKIEVSLRKSYFFFLLLCSSDHS